MFRKPNSVFLHAKALIQELSATLLLFSFMAWMACKMARPLFNLLDLIIKGNLAVDKVRHGIKADDIAREVIQEVPTNQGRSSTKRLLRNPFMVSRLWRRTPKAPL